jgi:hypothetical protein
MTVEQRIAKLERRCRMLSILLGGFALLVAIGALAGATQIVQVPVRFHQVDIVDLNGNVRIRLGNVEDAFGIFLQDAAGQARATLSEDADGTVLSVAKEGGNIRLLAAKQAADITLRDGRGNVRAVTTATQAGAEIQLRAANGEVLTIPPAVETPAP